MMNFLMSPVQGGHGDYKSQCPCASGCPPALVVCCTGLDFSVLDSTVVFFSSLRGQAKSEHDSLF